MSNIRVVTLKKDIPDDTVSYPGFHLLDMGKEGTWLVDQEHPGYAGCLKKAIRLAEADKDHDRVKKYLSLPAGKLPNQDYFINHKYPDGKLPKVQKKKKDSEEGTSDGK